MIVEQTLGLNLAFRTRAVSTRVCSLEVVSPNSAYELSDLYLNRASSIAAGSRGLSTQPLAATLSARSDRRPDPSHPDCAGPGQGRLPRIFLRCTNSAGPRCTVTP